MEWSFLSRHRLLADKFAYVFDDLQFPGPPRAFKSICEALKHQAYDSTANRVRCAELRLRGWLGGASEADIVGVITTFAIEEWPMTADWLLKWV